jgi:protein gp37
VNRTKIEYCDYTWNPITGCRHGCSYCYARHIAARYHLYGGSFEPQFHPKQLEPNGSETNPRTPTDTKKPSSIFVCDMGDIFSPGTKKEWREKVKAACDKAPWHTYLWLTKSANGRPRGYDETWVRSNWWLGATITGPEDAYRQEVCEGENIWYSYEPLLGIPDLHDTWEAKQVVIGAATKSDLPYCKAWGQEIARRYKGYAKVFVKSNGIWDGAPRELAWAKHQQAVDKAGGG